MEKNIKRVEKLVHATNSALAQMKFSLMFDDFDRAKNENSESILMDKFLEKDELKQCQNEFRSETNEMLAKMEKMFGSKDSSRKNSTVVDQIKEINKKLNREQWKPLGTEQSRQKLFSLINEEKYSPGKSSDGGGSAGSTQAVLPSKEAAEKRLLKSDPVLSSSKCSKAELKKKILETQEIVDRGFQTARQLSAKVENISKKEKTPSIEKSSSLVGKMDSNETIQPIRCRRPKRKKPEPVNIQVIDVKKKECKCPNLQVQHLPSVHIKGGLTIQKIHNFEIPGVEETTCEKLNTTVSFLTHEQLENERMRKVIEKVQKENSCFIENNRKGNYIECFNCGKIIQVRENPIDPRKVDEILLKCNFNVFDPRIDEFVEKYGAVPSEEAMPPIAPEPKPKIVHEKPVERKKPQTARFTLREFSDQLFRKYKKEVETLEDNHLKVDAILQELFRKVDESREVFEDCHLLKNYQKMGNLTSTKPVLIILKGKKTKKKKLRRKIKVRTDSRIRLTSPVPSSPETFREEFESKTQNILASEEVESQPKMTSIRRKTSLLLKEDPKLSTHKKKAEEEKQEPKTSREQSEDKKLPTNVTSPEKTESNYESDFESEPEEKQPSSAKKLSTVSEIDSELEKKTSKEAFPNTTAQSTPTELVTSLKDILSALQNQFARTESLAEKLTKDISPGGGMWKLPGDADLIENLHSARKDRGKEAFGSPGREGKEKGSSSESLSEEGGSSIGEIIVTGKSSDGSSISGRIFPKVEKKSNWLMSGPRETNSLAS